MRSPLVPTAEGNSARNKTCSVRTAFLLSITKRTDYGFIQPSDHTRETYINVSLLRVVQLNIGRAAAVNDQLLDYCQQERVDIAMVQEPYTNRGRLVGFEVAPFKSFLSKGTRRRGRPDYVDHGAAIIVFNPNLVVVLETRAGQKTSSAWTLIAVKTVS